MEEVRKGIQIHDWYNRFDDKLKSLNETHLKNNIIKSEIIENQRLLEEYKMDQQNKQKKVMTKRKIILNNDIDKRLLKRANIHNFKELDNENVFLKYILQKIKERKEKIKNGKNLPFKRYKTNNDYDNLNSLFKNNTKIQITPKKNKNINNIRPQNIRILTNKPEINYEKINTTFKKERPLTLKHNTNLILNLNTEENKNQKEYSIKDIINYNNNENKKEGTVNNFFETLSHEDINGIKNSNSKKNYNIKNMIKMIKIVRDGLNNCELSGNLLNKNIEKTRRILKLNNSAIKKNNSKLVIKINYSKIKDIKDVEKQIFSFQKEDSKNSKSVSKIKLRKRKDEIDKRNNNEINKKFLILPICTPNNKSYLKKADNLI